jgi:hypothetical protein
VTCGQKDTTGCLAFSDDMTGSRSTQDTVLTDQKLLHTVCSSDLCDQLHHFRVPVSSITTNDQEAAFDTFWDGKENAGDERFGVVRLLEDDDLFPQPRAIQLLALEGYGRVGCHLRSRLLVGEGSEGNFFDTHCC